MIIDNFRQDEGEEEMKMDNVSITPPPQITPELVENLTRELSALGEQINRVSSHMHGIWSRSQDDGS